MNAVQKMKSVWRSIFIIDNDAIDNLNDVLRQMQSLSKDDKKIIGKSLKK